jgi:hypothetical protein
VSAQNQLPGGQFAFPFPPAGGGGGSWADAIAGTVNPTPTVARAIAEREM